MSYSLEVEPPPPSSPVPHQPKKPGANSVKSVQHFYVTTRHSVKDFSIKGILLADTEFEGYWQTRLMTLEPYGLNGKDEWARMLHNKRKNVF